MKTSKNPYTKTYFTDVTVKSTAINQKYIQILSDLDIKLPGLTVCDIGCADGSFLELIQNDTTIYGCDISEHIIRKAQQKLNCSARRLAVLNLDQQSLPFSVKFDIITMFDVIEHIRNHIPLKEIIQTRLKKGGYFLVTTPNANSFLRYLAPLSFTGEVDSSHTMLFTPYTMDFYLRRLGLKKVVLATPYSFYFKNNSITQTFLWGGQIVALYKKV